MSLRKRAKYTFPEGVTYLEFINSKVGIIRDVLLHELLEDMGFSTPLDWARSNYEPDKLFEALDHYGNGIRIGDLGDVQRRVLHHAFGKVKARYAVLAGTLEAASYDDVLAGLKKTKSSGAPYFRPKGEVLTEAAYEASDLEIGLGRPEPCVAYYRTQTAIDVDGSARQKVRLVWGYPIAMTILEGLAAVPAINAVCEWKTQPIVSGRRRSEVGALAASFGWFPVVYSFDWSKFDATVPGFLISWAFEIIRAWFKPGALTEKYWDQVVRYFITTPIVMPDGHVYAGKRSGIPSGSYFTSLVGSLINQMLIEAASAESGVQPIKIAVLGDDSIVAFGRDPDSGFMQQWSERLGMKLKVIDRNFHRVRGRSKSFHFLGHTWHLGRPVRPIVETQQRIVYPERDIKKAIDEVGIKVYRFEKLLALYADNVEAYLLIRCLIEVLCLGRIHTLELGKTVRHRGDFMSWDSHTQGESEIALLSFK